MADYKMLPDVSYSEAHFELLRFISSSRTHGGVTNIVEYGDPIWQFSLTTAPLTYSDGAMFDAWVHSLRGGLVPVLVKNPHYCTPRRHIKNRGAETTSATLSVISSVSRSRFQFNGVSNALRLSEGDFITLNQGDKYHLGKIYLVDVNQGTGRVVEIEPPIPAFISAGATVYFDRAHLLMRPVWDSYEPWTRETKTLSMKFMETRA